MPTNRRTNTPERSIFFILEDRTTVIIIGNPSGTATTKMDMATLNARIKWGTAKEGSHKR